MKAFWLVLALVSTGALAAACGDGGGEPTATPNATPTAPAAPSAGATPVATPTPAAAAVPWPTIAVSAPAEARIAFVSDRDGNSEIYVMNDDGSGLTNLTNDPADDRRPAWAPAQE